MKNIVDLSVFENQTLDIKLPDGELIKISKPTQRMAVKLMSFQRLNDATLPEDLVAAVDNMALSILGSNENMRVFTSKDIEALNFPMKMALIDAYSKFLMGLQNNPN